MQFSAGCIILIRVRILFIGDITSRAGRKAVRNLMDEMRTRFAPDVVIANGENCAGGVGVTREAAAQLFTSGINLLTGGNHIWDKERELLEEMPILRPANYPDSVGGKGRLVHTLSDGRKLGVLNLLGRVFLARVENPFHVADREIALLAEEAKVIFVDFHAEATSEKIALAHYLDGRVSAVVGTHTHVQTSDARILEGGTAYITDVGMVGSHDSVIGVDKKIIIGNFLTGMPARFEAGKGVVRLDGVFIEISDEDGKARKIESFSLFDEDKIARKKRLEL
jgi:2',3'-cyclic-nucleotide 2'-phosphodiesterase